MSWQPTATPGEWGNRGELYLSHKHNGVDMQIQYAAETLKRIHTLWQRPVHLQALIDDEMNLFSYSGDKVQQQTIRSDTPEPANKI